MRIRHARVELALHELASGPGRPLLLLHELGGSSTDWAEAAAGWPGPVYALDFCGHGRSGWVRGGSYQPELLAGDADAALAHIESAAVAVAGAGLGAYVALLLAGGRSEQVCATLLLPGRGLAGGGPAPDFTRPFLNAVTPAANPPLPAGCDPMLCFLEWDVRPVDYAERLARAARCLFLLDDGSERPPWWAAVREIPAARMVRTLDAGLAALAEGNGDLTPSG